MFEIFLIIQNYFVVCVIHELIKKLDNELFVTQR